jgi:hypothetical protein
VGAFADSLIDELSAVGNSLVMPSLNSKIKDIFGFDFSDMLPTRRSPGTLWLPGDASTTSGD